MIVYRVDDELLTCVEVDDQSLHDDLPMNYWLPVLFGEGEHCYFTNKDEAKRELVKIIDAKIEALTERRKHWQS